MQTIREPSRIQGAWEREYARLARAIVSVLPSDMTSLVDAGCGRGRLTVPLASLKPDIQIDAIDRFEGPYAPHRERLREALKAGDLAQRVRIVSGDALTELRRYPSGSLDVIVSSELLPELDETSLARFFAGCFRVLREGGVTAHAFLSPIPRTEGQKLTIEADSDPRWTAHPPTEWFSPSPESVRGALVAAGFRAVHVETLRGRLRFTERAAQEQLREWAVRASYYSTHEGALRVHGLELPDWTILSGSRLR